jgi:hypothetical protein
LKKKSAVMRAIHSGSDKHSKNERAGKLMGFRPEGVIPIDFPWELGYECPKCNKRGFLWWSEYRGFIWCERCNYDYASPLCMPDLERANDIFLTIVEEIKKAGSQ